LAWLLDTSVALLLRDADTEADHHLASLDSIPSISIVSHIELEGGVIAKPALAAKRRSALDALLDVLPVLPFDPACAAAYRKIVESTGFSRRKVIDRMIAATALVNHLSLITLNRRDFVDVPGLDLEVWPTP
jgi:tRNA(fMet)-specific endonuclease VapC